MADTYPHIGLEFLKSHRLKSHNCRAILICAISEILTLYGTHSGTYLSSYVEKRIVTNSDLQGMIICLAK